MPGPAKPGGPVTRAGVGGEAVDVGRASSPASAIASRAASSVRSRPLRPRRRPDGGLADARDDRPSFEVGHDSGSRAVDRLEEREAHVVVLLEHDLHRHADPHVVGRAARRCWW